MIDSIRSVDDVPDSSNKDLSIYQIRQKWQELQVLTYQTTKEVK